MHPALEALTPEEADRLASDGLAQCEWLDAHGVAWSPAALAHIQVRAAEYEPALALPHPRREDTAALRELVALAAKMPRRQREIAALCLDQGLSLSECAARLGIGRETVRTHLRRLRATYLMVRRRAAQERAWAEDVLRSGDAPA